MILLRFVFTAGTSSNMPMDAAYRAARSGCAARDDRRAHDTHASVRNLVHEPQLELCPARRAGLRASASSLLEWYERTVSYDSTRHGALHDGLHAVASTLHRRAVLRWLKIGMPRVSYRTRNVPRPADPNCALPFCRTPRRITVVGLAPAAGGARRPDSRCTPSLL
jgi:hypothetical protein